MTSDAMFDDPRERTVARLRTRSAGVACNTQSVRQRILLSVVGVVALCGAFLIGQEFSSRTATTTAPATHPAISVPLLREDFTLLPCSQLTTIGLEGCAEHQILRLDAGINTLRKYVFTTLRTSAPRNDFVDAEIAWTAYRSSSCRGEAAIYQGGTLAPVVFANCLVRSNRRHLTALREFAAQLSAH